MLYFVLHWLPLFLLLVGITETQLSLLLFAFRNEMFLLEKGKFTQIQEENQVQ